MQQLTGNLTEKVSVILERWEWEHITATLGDFPDCETCIGLEDAIIGQILAQLSPGVRTMNPKKYVCKNCKMFRCPIIMRYPKTKGCEYGPDILTQIKVSKKSKSRDFEEVVKELGI